MENSSPKVLVCDDSVLARKQLIDVVRECGIEQIVEATDGQSAVEVFEKEKPDLTFLDIVMPIKDGTQATADIIAANPDAVIIIVSSIGTQGQLKKALEAGAKDFIQKPFQVDQIKAIIAKRLGGK